MPVKQREGKKSSSNRMCGRPENLWQRRSRGQNAQGSLKHKNTVSGESRSRGVRDSDILPISLERWGLSEWTWGSWRRELDERRSCCRGECVDGDSGKRSPEECR